MTLVSGPGPVEIQVGVGGQMLGTTFVVNLVLLPATGLHLHRRNPLQPMAPIFGTSSASTRPRNRGRVESVGVKPEPSRMVYGRDTCCRRPSALLARTEALLRPACTASSLQNSSSIRACIAETLAFAGLATIS